MRPATAAYAWDAASTGSTWEGATFCTLPGGQRRCRKLAHMGIQCT